MNPTQPDTVPARRPGRAFTVERAVPLMAAIVIAISIVLVATTSQWWLLLTGFVAANLALFAIVGWCPASLIMARLGLERGPACPSPR